MAEVDRTRTDRCSSRTAPEIGICWNRSQPAVLTTLLNLVQRVLEHTDSDDEAVAIILKLIGSGRVRLCGIFAGTRLRVDNAKKTIH